MIDLNQHTSRGAIHDHSMHAETEAGITRFSAGGLRELRRPWFEENEKDFMR